MFLRGLPSSSRRGVTRPRLIHWLRVFRLRSGMILLASSVVTGVSG